MTPAVQILLAATLTLSGWGGPAALAAEDEPGASQLPAELRGAKVYRLPEETKPGEVAENPVLFRGITYEDINLDRLVLRLHLSVKPVDRAATIRRIYFQNFQAGGIPVQIETFEKEFKLSEKAVVDLPAPLTCSIVFSDVGSVAPLKEIVGRDSLRITGRSFIEVKLNVLEKLVLRTKRLVLPVDANEEVPLQMFSGNPLLQMAANKILDTLSDPSATAAMALAREHLAKLAAERALASLGRASLYLLYCEYVLRNPKTGAAEKFAQSGTGFVVGADGKLLTAKCVIQPWKFDPQIAFLMKRHHLELDEKSYELSAWPAGARVASADGQLDFKAAFRTTEKTLRVVKTLPDRMEKQDYQDPDTGEEATLSVHIPGENDAAVLRLVGSTAQPLPLADSGTKPAPGLKTALLGFPFGLSQAQAEPKPIFVQVVVEGSLVRLEHQLNPGESGAPLLTPDGKVLAFCGSTRECIPTEAVRNLIR